MKYIRTEDGIYVAPTNAEIPSFIKYSDTIEELCDEFVCCYDHNMYGVFGNLEYAKTQNPKVLYGAIFTDKGLIYVAKMNNKGTLELL